MIIIYLEERISVCAGWSILMIVFSQFWLWLCSSSSNIKATASVPFFDCKKEKVAALILVKGTRFSVAEKVLHPCTPTTPGGQTDLFIEWQRLEFNKQLLFLVDNSLKFITLYGSLQLIQFLSDLTQVWRVVVSILTNIPICPSKPQNCARGNISSFTRMVLPVCTIRSHNGPSISPPFFA